MPILKILPSNFASVIPWILSILFLCHQLDTVNGFARKVVTKSFITDHHRLQSDHIARSFYFPIQTMEKRNIIVIKAKEGENEEDDLQDSTKESKENNKLFSFLSSTLDVIGTTTYLVIGAGFAMGILLNLSGYGYTLPSKDRMYIKIETLETMRANNQFNRVAGATTPTKKAIETNYQ